MTVHESRDQRFKLSETHITDARRRHDAGESLRSIAKSFGVSHVALSKRLAPRKRCCECGRLYPRRSRKAVEVGA